MIVIENYADQGGYTSLWESQLNPLNCFLNSFQIILLKTCLPGSVLSFFILRYINFASWSARGKGNEMEWKGCLFWKYSLQALCILICHFLQLYSVKTAKQLFPYLSVLLLIMKTIILFRLYCSANIFQILGSIVPGSNTNNKANDLHQSERNRKYFEWMILSS